MVETRSDGRPIVSFAKLRPIMPMPNLLDVQLRAFEKLIQPLVLQLSSLNVLS